MQPIELAERRRRLVVRHRLNAPRSSVESLAEQLVGLHSSDPATVYLAARARIAGFEVEDLEEALYDHRSLVRVLGMRRTMFVVPPDLAAVIEAACTVTYARPERRRLIRLLEEQGVAADGAAWLRRVERKTLRALGEAGEATANELRRMVPELTQRLAFGEGRSWGGTMGVSTRVLYLLATEARVVRARPRGSWLSSQYRWTATDRWLEGGIPRLPAAVARSDLARRWLRAFGPGTFRDLQWWTGWTARATRAALKAVEVVEVDLDGAVGYLLPDDLSPTDLVEPTAALLPALDPTVMGWKDRDWYLGGHGPALFDRNGNAGPTVWWQGRIVGGWGQRPDGSVATHLLEEVGAEASSLIGAEAARLTEWLGAVRVTPRFRTPLEEEISG